MSLLLSFLLLQVQMQVQVQAPALENEYVRVMQNASACASGRGASCTAERVIVALGDTELGSGGILRTLRRGEVAVFRAGEAHEPPRGGPYYEVAFKADHPPVASPGEFVPPDKNVTLYDGDRFFVFEERLAVGDTRVRHSHSQRVVIQLNRTRLQQWPDGQPEVLRDIVPDGVAFNPPVMHVVKNVGELPLRGIVIEMKARR